ncbi:MAG: hypothetical protein AABY09_00885, partial [Nanoarchaeota archaeon]
MELKNNTKITKSHSINKQHQKFLDFITKYPQYGTSQIYHLMELSARQGNKIKVELEELGLVEVVEKRSIAGWKKVLKTTAKATEILAENPVEAGIAA